MHFVDHCDILIFYISVILYLFAEGYKCLTTFPTRFAHVIYILRYCHCFASLKVLCHEQMNKCHQISLNNNWLAIRIMHQTAKRIFLSILDTKLHVNTQLAIYVDLLFQTHMAQPNQLKANISHPLPTRPNRRVNPSHRQRCADVC